MDYFEADVDRSTCYMRRHQGAKVKHFDVSNVIYHKFSDGAVSYTLSGENVNVKLESNFAYVFVPKMSRLGLLMGKF